MTRDELNDRLRSAETGVRWLLASSRIAMSEAEANWWRRMLGNLEKAQHDYPHISNRHGDGGHNG